VLSFLHSCTVSNERCRAAKWLMVVAQMGLLVCSSRHHWSHHRGNRWTRCYYRCVTPSDVQLNVFLCSQLYARHPRSLGLSQHRCMLTHSNSSHSQRIAHHTVPYAYQCHYNRSLLLRISFVPCSQATTAHQHGRASARLQGAGQDGCRTRSGHFDGEKEV
jgi:hypothetical protein